ncbi:MAG: DUF4037 domain-containing protein [Clostridia bacterium]|nr:DUF4037 domain-containing protein [Clostridia bacterium]
MKGLELSEKYYLEFGAKIIKDEFPEYESVIAAGLTGSGSDCYGYDDEISTDHDFEPGFILFLPDESVIDSKTEFRLERAYAKLPKEFMGFKRSLVSAVGGSRYGVKRIADFFTEKVGDPDGELSIDAWLKIPSFYFAEATNGKIFRDDLGKITAIRNKLLYMPEDITLKKLAGNLILMAQAGQYNYYRCIKHGEYQASQLSAVEFVNATLKTVYLLNGKHMPFYKWAFRGLKELSFGAELNDDLSNLLFGDNRDETTADGKLFTIESIAERVIDELKKRGLTSAVCGDIEKHAYSVNDRISDPYIRNLNIFSGV